MGGGWIQEVRVLFCFFSPHKQDHKQGEEVNGEENAPGQTVVSGLRLRGAGREAMW